MRLLLDTHTFLWFVEGSSKLSSTAREAIEDTQNEALLSVASLWEIAIKLSLGKLTLSTSLDRLIADSLQDSGIASLEIKPDHLISVATLPFHHRDPFDRMIIAQALTERLSLVTIDPMFDLYSVSRIW